MGVFVLPENEVILQHESGVNRPFAVPIPPGRAVEDVVAVWAKSGHELVRTADADDPTSADPSTEYPKPSASKAEWVSFAAEHGVSEEQTESLGRNQIRDLFIPPAEPASQ